MDMMDFEGIESLLVDQYNREMVNAEIHLTFEEWLYNGELLES